MKHEYERMLDVSREEQIKQLEANEDKGGWDNLNVNDDIIPEINWNLDNLMKAIEPAEIRRLLANIANYAGMGLDIMRGHKKEEEEG